MLRAALVLALMGMGMWAFSLGWRFSAEREEATTLQTDCWGAHENPGHEQP